MAEAKTTLGSLRFGRFELSADTGELRKDGVRLKLSGQAIQVLSMLTANPGQLVTREELQQKLWPGASYGDPEHGLNAAVNKLRETLGDSATEPTYIETVPGRGYRFIAALEQRGTSPEPPKPTLELQLPQPPWWKRKATFAVAACIVVVSFLCPWVSPQIESYWRLYKLKQLTVVPLTALPGNVWSPTFSPDGNQVAFQWHDDVLADGADLYVKIIGNDTPLRLTHRSMGVYSVMPSWSPDGKIIAFCRLAGASDSGIFVISPLGGPERRISSATCSRRYGNILSWTADGKRLAFLHHSADSPYDYTIGLFVLSVASGDEVPVKTDCINVATPAFSPRGEYLAWTCADNLSSVSINLQRLSDGKVIQLLRGLDGIGGLAWSGDARRIVFSVGLKGGDLWEVELAHPNRPEKLPFGHDATDIAVSPAGKRLVFNQNHINTNIWRVQLSQPQARAQKIVASSREQTAAQYSPDGSRIAFESNRTGSNEVWVSNSDGSNAFQLSSFGVTMTGTPRWSPDGKLIAFDSWVGGEANIYIVDPRGGAPKKLNIDLTGNNLPSWSHDGKWIYFVNGEDAYHSTVWKVPAEGGHAVELAQQPAEFPLESPDAQQVYFIRQNQLWSVNTDGSNARQVADLGFFGSHTWAPFGSGVYFLGFANNKQAIKFLDLDTKEVRPVFLFEEGRPVVGLSVSSDGRWLLFAQTDEISSDLMMVENWH
jgi:Tol biopolymer transport system component/DNA-binding winged helix-turn-helix (wHTH) protein